ncbi:hypothetical protein JYU14_04580, partial [Simkania negevensis]|nr:hypothetical protein [Simkania negevensis]
KKPQESMNVKNVMLRTPGNDVKTWLSSGQLVKEEMYNMETGLYLSRVWDAEGKLVKEHLDMPFFTGNLEIDERNADKVNEAMKKLSEAAELNEAAEVNAKKAKNIKT